MKPTLTIRSPEDVVALASVMLGFHPENSLVMLGVGGPRPLHARVDLPEAGDRTDDHISALVEPAVLHQLDNVLLIVFSRSPQLSERHGLTAAHAMRSAGITVTDVLVADGQQWWRAGGMSEQTPGTPYDLGAHRFLAQAVLMGRVVQPSRRALAATFDSSPELLTEVERELADQSRGPSRSPATELAWCRRLVGECTGQRREPSAPEIATVLLLLRDERVFSELWCGLTRARARDELDFWRAVTRGAPVDLRPAPATMAGYAAWLSGDGAVAWMAVEAALEAEPDHRLATLLSRGLTQAVDPTVWDRLFTDRADRRPA